RTSGGDDIFVLRSELGLRLVHIAPILASDGRRLGAIAAEHVLSRAVAGAAIAANDEPLPTPTPAASFPPRSAAAGEPQRAGTFVLRTESNESLVEGSVQIADLQAARQEWRRTVIAWVVVILGVTILLLIGPPLDARLYARGRAAYVGNTLLASILFVAGAA